MGMTSGAVRQKLVGPHPYQTVDFRVVWKTFQKFVATHRCHGDFLSGLRLFDNYISQPLPTTVEAHVYFRIEWVTDLPVLGMRRAMLAVLVGGAPAYIFPEPFAVIRSLADNHHITLGVSQYINHLWYWGEYFYAMRAAKDEVLNDIIDMNVQYRLSSVFSEMLGVKRPVAPFFAVGTRFRHCFESNFGIECTAIDIAVVKNRELDKTSTADQIEGIPIRRWNYTVPPSGVGMLIGSAGSLIAGTPYGPVVEATRPEVSRGRRRLIYRSTYLNTWTPGLVDRWNGYDHKYSDGTNLIRDQHLVMWTNNHDMLALPPVYDHRQELGATYVCHGSVERDRVFGFQAYDMLLPGVKRTSLWKTGPGTIKERFDRALDTT